MNPSPSTPQPEVERAREFQSAEETSLKDIVDFWHAHSLTIPVLLVSGLFLVTFAHTIGVYLNMDEHGGWNSDNALRTASTTRIVGLMLFGTGVLERVLSVWQKIAKAQSQPENELATDAGIPS